MTNVLEFEKFHNLLMKTAPIGYTPHYFLLRKKDKDPATPRGKSWKHKSQILSFENVKLKMEEGHNIGIAAMETDKLVIVDADNSKVAMELKPSLIITSRKRVGQHGFYWAIDDDKLPMNIPTNNEGEVRAVNQYVVVAGSYVPITEKSLAKNIKDGIMTEDEAERVRNDKLKGYYTVSNETPPINISFDELPEIFKYREKENAALELEHKTKTTFSPTPNSLYSITFKDLLPDYKSDDRSPHPLHDSDTGKNFVITGNLAHCWRHNVSLNPLQYMTVASGFMSCLDAGTGHKHSGAGPSKVKGNKLARDMARTWATEMGFLKIPDDTRLIIDEVKTLLLEGKKEDATEEITKHILDYSRIFTTRHDEKSEVWVYSNGVYIPQGRTYIKETCRLLLGRSFTPYIANQVIAKVEVDTFIEQDEFFNSTYPDLVCIDNGILNVKTRGLIEHSGDYIFFNKLPIIYDPKAVCPNISNFFKEVLSDKESVITLEEVFGFLLTDDYSMQTAVMFFGEGGNGKGITLQIMKHFLGVDNCTEISLEDLEKDIFSVGELFKKKANLCGDLSATALKNTGRFKNLTGGDLIAAARKFKARVKFINTAKMIFSCNRFPITYDLTTAFWRRWIIFKFPYAYKKNVSDEDLAKGVRIADPQLLSKLITPIELSGLLNLALEGLKRISTNMNFTKTMEEDEIKKEWLRHSDSFQAFIMDCVEEDYDSYITKSDFRGAYSKYCRYHKQTPSGDKVIKNILTKFGAWEKRLNDSNRTLVWEGIKLNGEENSYHRRVETLDEMDELPGVNEPNRKKSKWAIGGKTPDIETKSGRTLTSDYGEKTKKYTLEEKTALILETIKNYDKADGASTEDVVDWCVQFFPEEEFNKIYAQLKKEGTIFEPVPGKAKVV